MRRSDGFCKICKNYTETTSHLLYECNMIRELWLKISQNISNMINFDVILDKCICVIGFYHHDNEHIANFVNIILGEANWQIWKHRNEVKFGKKEVLNKDVLFNKIFRSCQQHSKNLQSTFK